MSLLTSVLKTVGPLIPDAATAWGARHFINHHYKSLGHMTSLQIDSANHRAVLELELKGETQPIQVTISRYELSSTDGKTFIEIKEFRTSREWMNVVGGQFLNGRKFEVPELLKALL
jgi:hypothetical protein